MKRTGNSAATAQTIDKMREAQMKLHWQEWFLIAALVFFIVALPLWPQPFWRGFISTGLWMVSLAGGIWLRFRGRNKLAIFLVIAGTAFFSVALLRAQEPTPEATGQTPVSDKQLRAENAQLKQQVNQLGTLLDWYKPQLWSCIDREVLLAKPRTPKQEKQQ